MRFLTTLLVIVLMTSACSSVPKKPIDMDDPTFVTWYKAASPYMRTAFFMSLCVASGFSRGSVDITICLSNQRNKARIRIEGTL